MIFHSGHFARKLTAAARLIILHGCIPIFRITKAVSNLVMVWKLNKKIRSEKSEAKTTAKQRLNRPGQVERLTWLEKETRAMK